MGLSCVAITRGSLFYLIWQFPKVGGPFCGSSEETLYLESILGTLIFSNSHAGNLLGLYTTWRRSAVGVRRLRWVGSPRTLDSRAMGHVEGGHRLLCRGCIMGTIRVLQCRIQSLFGLTP